MQRSGRARSVVPAVVGLVLLLGLPSPAGADGGPIVPDPELWAMIEEGQQIAVVELQENGICQVDLFVSMVDRSGESHEVIFFLPLGVGASDFRVVEETSRSFDVALTEPIEERVLAEKRRHAGYQGQVQIALLLGSVPTHAAWIGALTTSMFTWGGGAGAPPVATFETGSSQVTIYGIDAETDLQALIETTGLDPKVQETLAALRGQQIAVVKLQTMPAGGGTDGTHSGGSVPELGIHLGWRSTLVPDPGGATYRYPLGTGKAWASPIELTRVYVVAPPDLDFTVEYPELGGRLSGDWGSSALAWWIRDSDRPAFAVSENYGESGHAWRATYIKSNSDQDVVVRSLPAPSRALRRAIRRAKAQAVIGVLTWFLAPLAGLIAWVASWRVVMPRRLGVTYGWRQGKLYRDALLWLCAYVTTNLVAALLAYLLTELARIAHWDLPVAFAVIPLILTVPGLANAFLYALWRTRSLQVGRGQAFGAYMVAVLMTNGLYIAFALVYGAVVGAF